MSAHRYSFTPGESDEDLLKKIKKMRERRYPSVYKRKMRKATKKARKYAKRARKVDSNS